MLFPRIVSFGALVCVCLSLSPFDSSHVLVVAPSGGQFTNIQSAIDAAENGDSILVKAGSYPGFTIENRARLDVVAEAGQIVHVGAVLVKDCQGYIVLSGLSMHGATTTAGPWHALEIDNNTAPMRIVACTMDGGSVTCAGGQVVRVASSSDVEFVACTATAFQGSFIRGSDALNASSSSIALYDSAFFGGNSTCHSCFTMGYGIDGGDGVRMSGGFTFASRCEFRGGDGNDSDEGTDAGNGGYGLRAYGPGEAWTLDCVAQGGAGGTAGVYSGCCHVFLCCSCVYDGVPGLGIGGVFGGVATTLPGIGRTLTVPRVAREFTSVPITVDGEPNDMVYISLSNATGFTWQPAFSGVSLWSTVLPPEWRRFGIVGAGGTLARTIVFPDMGPGILARNWHFQTLHRDTQGVSILGPGRTMVLLDSSL